MKREIPYQLILFIIIIIFPVRNTFSQITFQKTFGGGNDDVAVDFEKTDDNGLLLLGYTSSFGMGSNDIILTNIQDQRAQLDDLIQKVESMEEFSTENLKKIFANLCVHWWIIMGWPMLIRQMENITMAHYRKCQEYSRKHSANTASIYVN